ncbi:MAG: 50S ribosomal protein L17 [Victivallales bacterium]|nr:50S ribosomal protein L17 [Victivallales bacterium]
MRHKVDTVKLGRTSAHRNAMLANMVSSLFMTGQVKTTVAKAKIARRVAEKLITLGKKGDLHRHRLAVSRLHDKTAVKKLFDEIAPQYQDRNGGYTRIIRTGVRIGDAAEMCLLQLVEGAAAAPAAAAPEAAAETAAENA